MESEHQAWWLRLARRQVRRINFGWWLDAFAPGLFMVSGVAALAVLGARALGADPRPFLAGYAAALLAVAHVSFLLVRKRRFGISDGLVRLDVIYRLDNALTAAEAGVAPWPPPLERADPHLRWVWQPPLGQTLGGLLLLAAAWWFPLQAGEASAPYRIEEPAAWRQVEAWLETLEEQALIEEASLEEIRRQLDRLREQPMERWYEHGSLEAGDTLNEQVRHSLREFQRHLETTVAGLSAMNAMPEAVPDAWKERWQRQMSEALEGLESGAIRLDAELASQLREMEIDPSQLRRLTPEEWQQLKELLENGVEACGTCTGEGTDLALLAIAMAGSGDGDAGHDLPGIPGISRGGGPDAPLFLRDRRTQLDTAGLERLTHEDFRHAAPGDLVAVTEREHEVDESLYTGPRQTGGPVVMGSGGETVWQQALDPEERRVVQEFFR